MKGGEGKGSGKGLNSGYSGYWKLEKVFFNGSVSAILFLLVQEGVSLLRLIWYFEKKKGLIL